MTYNPFIEPNGQPIAYVREVAPEDLPDKLRGTEAKLYALHDAEGNRYVDLVMEGGGVLGIALVGYTYVLESLGLLFVGLGE